MNRSKAIAILLITCTAVALIANNPVLSLNVAVDPYSVYVYPQPSAADLAATRLLSLVPSGASILTESYVFPLISSRLDAFTYPYQTYPVVSLIDYIYNLTTKVNYILVNLNYLSGYESGVYQAIILSFAEGTFGVLGYTNGMLLLERGYTGTPEIYEPFQETFTPYDLKIVSGNVTSQGTLVRDNGSRTGQDFWWGPYVVIPPGQYSVNFEMELGGGQTNSSVIQLGVDAFRYVADMQLVQNQFIDREEIISNSLPSLKTVIDEVTVNSSQLSTSRFENVTVNFDAKYWGAYEFTGLNVSTSESLYLRGIILSQTTPSAFFTPIPAQFEHGSLVYLDPKFMSTMIRLLDEIPASSSLLVQDDLLPLLPSTSQILALNNLSTIISLSTLSHDIAVADYILVNFPSDQSIASYVLENPQVTKNFGILSFSDGVYLLKRNFIGTLQLFDPISYNVSPEAVVPESNSSMESNRALNETVLVNANSSTISDFWWGPYIFLSPGQYKTQIYLVPLSKATGELFSIQANVFPCADTISDTNSSMNIDQNCVGSTKMQLELANISTSELKASLPSFESYSFSFNANYQGYYELAGRFISPGTQILFAGMNITMTEPSFIVQPQ